MQASGPPHRRPQVTGGEGQWGDGGPARGLTPLVTHLVVGGKGKLVCHPDSCREAPTGSPPPWQLILGGGLALVPADLKRSPRSSRGAYLQENPPNNKCYAGGVFMTRSPGLRASPRPVYSFLSRAGPLPGIGMGHFLKRNEEENANTSSPSHLPEDHSVSGLFTVGLTKSKGLPASEMTTKL